MERVAQSEVGTTKSAKAARPAPAKRAPAKAAAVVGPALLPRPPYEALDGVGLPYMREARTIDELPLDARIEALKAATETIANQTGLVVERTIHLGTPAFTAYRGMHRAAAKNHPHAKILLTAGGDLSLDLVPEYAAATASTKR